MQIMHPEAFEDCFFFICFCYYLCTCPHADALVNMCRLCLYRC